jgi:hypothetical protein
MDFHFKRLALILAIGGLAGLGFTALAGGGTGFSGSRLSTVSTPDSVAKAGHADFADSSWASDHCEDVGIVISGGKFNDNVIEPKHIQSGAIYPRHFAAAFVDTGAAPVDSITMPPNVVWRQWSDAKIGSWFDLAMRVWQADSASGRFPILLQGSPSYWRAGNNPNGLLRMNIGNPALTHLPTTPKGISLYQAEVDASLGLHGYIKGNTTGTTEGIHWYQAGNDAHSDSIAVIVAECESPAATAFKAVGGIVDFWAADTIKMGGKVTFENAIGGVYVDTLVSASVYADSAGKAGQATLADSAKTVTHGAIGSAELDTGLTLSGRTEINGGLFVTGAADTFFVGDSMTVILPAGAITYDNLDGDAQDSMHTWTAFADSAGKAAIADSAAVAQDAHWSTTAGLATNATESMHADSATVAAYSYSGLFADSARVTGAANSATADSALVAAFAYDAAGVEYMGLTYSALSQAIRDSISAVPDSAGVAAFSDSTGIAQTAWLAYSANSLVNGTPDSVGFADSAGVAGHSDNADSAGMSNSAAYADSTPVAGRAIKADSATVVGDGSVGSDQLDTLYDQLKLKDKEAPWGAWLNPGRGRLAVMGGHNALGDSLMYALQVTADTTYGLEPSRLVNIIWKDASIGAATTTHPYALCSRTQITNKPSTAILGYAEQTDSDSSHTGITAWAGGNYVNYTGLEAIGGGPASYAMKVWNGMTTFEDSPVDFDTSSAVTIHGGLTVSGGITLADTLYRGITKLLNDTSGGGPDSILTAAITASDTLGVTIGIWYGIMNASVGGGNPLAAASRGMPATKAIFNGGFIYERITPSAGDSLKYFWRIDRLK